MADETNYPDELWLRSHKVLWPDVRWADTVRLHEARYGVGHHSRCRNLIRHMLTEGHWTLPDPLEQVRRDAREIVAQVYEKDRAFHKVGKSVRDGAEDNLWSVQCVIAALAKERGIEVPS